MEQTLDQISPILPVDFFSVALTLKEGCTEPLPLFADLLFEETFADISMGWEAKGLHFQIASKKSFEDAFFPDYRKGDSVELFLDTRDLKSAGFLTRFCHHFVFFPKELEEGGSQEVTRFRTDDRHELCDPRLLECSCEFKRKGFLMKIFIPSECLYGYDPNSFDRIGFTYRINRPKGDPQHFVVSSDYLAIEQQPSLWSSIQMRKK
jgi:hypothetical protein